MPRDGSGIYTVPPGSDGVPNTTIASAKYNTQIHDVETDLNMPRPIIAGGTGGNSPASARAALQAERSTQPIGNFDSDPLEAGSFASASTATNPPVAGHSFSGIIYGADANNLVIEARDATDGSIWVRVKTGGTWGAWSSGADNSKVAKAGDTMSGNLTIAKTNPTLFLNDTAAGSQAITAMRAGLARWQANFGLNAETGSNAGSDFAIGRYNDAGALIDLPLQIARATGLITVNGDPTAALGVATKQYVDAQGGAGAVRFDIAQPLTAAQQLQGRKNIYAAPLDALGYFGVQVNGEMKCSQEYNGGNQTITSGSVFYVVDQWIANHVRAGVVMDAQRTAMSLVTPHEFGLKYHASTGNAAAFASSEYHAIFQHIEALRMDRLGWNTPFGVPVTISFWIYATTPGTASICIRDSTNNYGYATTFTVDAANTAQYVQLTIPPPPGGNWQTGQVNLGGSVLLCFGAGSDRFATNGANVWGNTGGGFALPGLTNFFAANNTQVVPTGFSMHPGPVGPSSLQSANAMRHYDDELRICKRYFQYKIWALNAWQGDGNAYTYTIPLSERMRAVPSVTGVVNSQSGNQGGYPTFGAGDEESLRCAMATNGPAIVSASVTMKARAQFI